MCLYISIFIYAFMFNSWHACLYELHEFEHKRAASSTQRQFFIKCSWTMLFNSNLEELIFNAN